MSGRLDRVYARTVFYEALSGKLTTPPLRGIYTLGSVALATIDRGDPVPNEDDEVLQSFEYKSSLWELGINATAACLASPHDQTLTLMGLSLRAPNGSTMSVNDAALPDRERVLSLSRGDRTSTYPLALGDQLESVKRAVTRKAQEFVQYYYLDSPYDYR